MPTHARLAALAAAMSATLTLADTPEIGDLCPDLGLETLMNAPEGSAATLEALRGKVVVLEFWATWCGPCVGAIPHLNELRAAYQDRGVVFVSVTDEARETVERFQRSEPSIKGWIGLDTDRSLFDAFGVRAIPETIVLDGYGRVAARTNPAALTPEALDGYLSGKRDTPRASVPVATTVTETLADRVLARLTGVIIPGFDPLDESRDVDGTRFVLRPTALGDETRQSVMTSGTAITGIGMTGEMVLRHFRPGPASLVDTSVLAGDLRRYDLIVSQDFPADAACRLAFDRLGVRPTVEHRRVPGFRAVLAPEGLSGLSEFDKETGWRTTYNSKTRTMYLESDNMAVGDLLAQVSQRLGVPFEDATGRGDARLRVHLGIGGDASLASLSEQLERDAGLHLEPVELEREVVVFVPVGEGGEKD